MGMKQFYIIAAALFVASCSARKESPDGYGLQDRMPVLLSAGSTQAVLTRAESASYMPQDSRFVCSMFFHAGAKDGNDTPFYSQQNPLREQVNTFSGTLTIEGSQGNARYDEDGSFYWQNRLNHVFLALAHNHSLDKAPVVSAGDRIAYDLSRQDGMTRMAHQPDPMVAHVVMTPEGATAEANRVKLFFKHQFSQLQVNLRNAQDASVTIGATQILSVELLGVAETAYVSYSITPEGELPATTSEPVNVDDPKYNDTKKDNPYGSSFSLFEGENTAPGYLKSFEGIAFGTLQGIRITWKESEAENAVVHKATFKGVRNLALESGRKYIYNIELRRSLIAQVKAEITDWEEDKEDYNAEGTIQE